MAAADISAWASVGTVVVIVVTALAAFVQLRHMGVLNGLTVLNEFYREYERVAPAATAAMPSINEHLRERDARLALGIGGAIPDWGRDVMPLIRLFEILGTYTNRDIVPHDVVTDMWAPVVVSWWDDLTPFIAVLRRSHGPAMFENWEAIMVPSKKQLDRDASTYPRGLPRIGIADPWPEDSSGER